MTTNQRRGWAIVTTLCVGAVLASVLAQIEPGDPFIRAAPVPLSRTAVVDAMGRSATDDALEVRVRLPARLLAGNEQQFHVEITGTRGQPLDDGRLLDIRLRTDLADDVRGHAWVTPTKLLTTPATLGTRHFHLGTTLALPCDAQPGSLHIEVRTLDVDGPRGERRVSLPVWPCDLTAVPEAPDSVHITAPVCGVRWRDDLQTLIEGGKLRPLRCQSSSQTSLSRERTIDPPDRVSEETRSTAQPAPPPEPAAEPQPVAAPTPTSEPDPPAAPEPSNDADADDPDPGEPAAPEPAAPEPTEPESAAPEPAAPEPAAPEPTATEPAALEPTALEPTATEQQDLATDDAQPADPEPQDPAADMVSEPGTSEEP